MNSWTKLLLGELGNCGETARHETETLYEVEVERLTEDLWDQLKSVKAREAELSLRVRVYTDPSDEQNLLDYSEVPASSRLTLAISKGPVDKSLRFFERKFLLENVAATPEILERSSTVFVADIDVGPTSLGQRTLPWRDPLDASVFSPEEAKSPRLVVNDASGRGVVPQRISPWLTRESDLNLMWEFYGPTASRRLSMVLPTALIEDEARALMALTEIKRRTKIGIEPPQDEVWSNLDLYKELNDLAYWIYVEGQDTDNRHSIVASEIARSLPKEKLWGKGLADTASNTLETAKIAYRLHLYDKSVDALKLMSDLRKGLAEDVKSVSAQTTALSAGLWRDSAVAFGGLAIKAAGGGTPVLLLTSVYLATSYVLNTKAAMQAVTAITKNEQMFRRKLYLPIIPEKEYSEISGARYEEVISDFGHYKTLVFRIYVTAILCLTLYAVWSSFDVTSCFSSHFARWLGRLAMPDSTSFFTTACLA
ncbi:hypothetical protein RU07_20835 [Agrobacterium tumefaciens]|uniref:Uncharacterized protein n=1 Tax=Agrobacterium tumefaciens TaxID=358 RepID=A0A0D0JUE1_AGRTU|nr:hypothetical protein RU07_20835 [Agrobacterium tumefaciens]